MALTPKICPVCQGAAGMPYMKGVVTQKFDMTTKVPEITEWTCPYCGHKETDTIEFAQSGGNYNSGIVQGPVA
jgi:C4-type Zn-finger protein